MSDPIIDSVFEKAFNSYADKIFESYPTDEEMKKAYPVSPRRAKLYERIARAYKNGHSKRNKLSDYVACSFAGSDIENELDTQKAYTILEKQAKKNEAKRKSKVLKILLVVSILLALLVGTVIAVNYPEIKKVLHKVTYDNGGVSFDYVPSTSTKMPDISVYSIEYIPAGYELSTDETWDNNSKRMRKYLYYCGDRYLFIEILDMDVSSVYLTDTYPSHTVKMIEGRETHIYYNDAYGEGSIVAMEGKVIIYIHGCMPQEELVKIIENIKR